MKCLQDGEAEPRKFELQPRLKCRKITHHCADESMNAAATLSSHWPVHSVLLLACSHWRTSTSIRLCGDALSSHVVDLLPVVPRGGSSEQHQGDELVGEPGEPLTALIVVQCR